MQCVYPTLIGVTSNDGMTCIGRILGMSREFFLPQCVNGTAQMASTAFNSPIVYDVGLDNIWVLLEDGAIAYFAAESTSGNGVVFPGFLPDSIKPLAGAVSNGYSALFAVDTSSGEAVILELYLADDGSYAEIDKKVLSLPDWKGKVDLKSGFHFFAIDLNANLAWLASGTMGKVLKLEFMEDKWSVQSSTNLSHPIVNGAEDFFLRHNLRVLYVDGEDAVKFGSVDGLAFGEVSPLNTPALPSGSLPLKFYLGYSYGDSAFDAFLFSKKKTDSQIVTAGPQTGITSLYSPGTIGFGPFIAIAFDLLQVECGRAMFTMTIAQGKSIAHSPGGLFCHSPSPAKNL